MCFKTLFYTPVNVNHLQDLHPSVPRACPQNDNKTIVSNSLSIAYCGVKRLSYSGLRECVCFRQALNVAHSALNNLTCPSSQLPLFLSGDL